MKHLFVVHSPITELVARRVVEHEGLDARQVLLWRYRPTAEVALNGLREVTYVPPRLTRGLLSTRRRLGRLDRFLSGLVGEESFHLYVPQTYLAWIQAAISHPACAGFSYIEEGLAAYYSREQLEAKLPVHRPSSWERRKSRGRVGASEFFRPGYAHAYGICDEAFPWLERRVVLGDVFAGEAPEGTPREVEWVLATDDLHRTRGVPAAAVLHGIDRGLATLAARGVRRVHFKLHPAQQGTDQVQAIERALARHSGKLKLIELDPRLSLERLAHARPSASFLVGLSSVGLYAAWMGREVASTLGFAGELAPAALEHLHNLPPAYRARLEVLAPEPHQQSARQS